MMMFFALSLLTNIIMRSCCSLATSRGSFVATISDCGASWSPGTRSSVVRVSDRDIAGETKGLGDVLGFELGDFGQSVGDGLASLAASEVGAIFGAPLVSFLSCLELSWKD